MSSTLQSASEIFQYLCYTPRVVCFAAFKDNKLTEPVLELVCVANHKQWDIIDKMKDDSCSRLVVATGFRKMRQNDAAYLKINGADVGVEPFLSFYEGEYCRRNLSVSDTEQDEDNMVLHFFPKPEENLNLLLCTLKMSKDMVFSRERNPSAQQLQDVEQAQPGDKINDFVDECDRFAMYYQHCVPLSDLEETILLKHSIGAIITNENNVPKCVGTCFRIGTKYVITNQHVVDKIINRGIQWSSCKVDFNYQEQGAQTAGCTCFNFTPDPVSFSSKELDYAILDLCSNGVEDFPPSVTDPKLGFKIAPAGLKLEGGECLTLIGHPGGKKKHIDVSCPIKREEDIQNLKRTNKYPQLQEIYDNPDCATYDVSTFFWGSSGSPGLLVEEKLLVVLHGSGIATQGTNEHHRLAFPTQPRTNKRHVLEYGHLMSSVVEDVKKKIEDGTIPNVTNADEIFGPSTLPSNLDSPQPKVDDPSQNEVSASG